MDSTPRSVFAPGACKRAGAHIRVCVCVRLRGFCQSRPDLGDLDIRKCEDFITESQLTHSTVANTYCYTHNTNTGELLLARRAAACLLLQLNTMEQ